MDMTRRDFARLGLAGVPALVGISTFAGLTSSALAQTPAARRNNRSYINGVQFGIQPFCYHDLPMTRENRGELIKRIGQNGLGMVELHATFVEPRFNAPGVSAQQAREQMRQWRLNPPAGYYQNIRKEFDEAGIEVFSYYVGPNESFTDAEIDAVFEGAKVLGCKGCVGSYGIETTKRLAPFPGKHGMFLGIHNHDNLSDPDAYSTEATFEKGLALSPDIKATLDTRHFTAANGDCVGFLEKHHDRVSSIHLGDRRRNNGRSTPFGEGDAPIIQVLRLIRDNQWPIPALLEFEHGTIRPAVEEVQLMFDYCKRAVA